MELFWGLCVLTLNLVAQPDVYCDEDSNCYYVPSRVACNKNLVPGLIVLQCNGATRGDIDSFRLIADSLNWALATCHASRNHRDIYLNDADIYHSVKKLINRYPVDSSRIVIYGFSGQGGQALATALLHPELIRGVVAVCAPMVAPRLADSPSMFANNFIYLVTREKDWNCQSNYRMFEEFASAGVACTLLVTKGEHQIGSLKEVLAGCRWLDKRMSGR